MNETLSTYDPNDPIQNLERLDYDSGAITSIELANPALDIESVRVFPLTKERAEYLEKIEKGELAPDDILEMCASEDIAVRYVGALCLEEMSAFPEEGRDALYETAKLLCQTDASEYIRETGFKTLGRLGGKTAITILISFMGNDDMRPYALGAFCALGEQGFQFVRKWVTKNKKLADSHTQEGIGGIAIGLRKTGSDIALKRTLRLLKDIETYFGGVLHYNSF